jgi:hypothetical protein
MTRHGVVMRRYLYIGLITLLLQASGSSQSANEREFLIKGQVVDANGLPTAGVTVFAYPDSLHGKLPSSTSDARGRFTIVVSKAGPYVISTSKTGDGYPHSLDPFYNPSGESLAQILVEESRPPQFVTILLGPKVGKVVGKVVDAETNRPIEDFQIRLCRTEAPNYCHRHSVKTPRGLLEFLVPSAPFTIQIFAAGYRDWNGADEVRQQATPLLVASNTTRELNVSLEKLSAGDDNIPVLAAPIVLSPADGTEFKHFPRVTKLDWSVVPGAASYEVEVDFCMPGGADGKECKYPQPLNSRFGPTSGIEATSYQFLFPGSQPGRWRVWAVDRQGRAGAKSAWHHFVYVYRL